MKRGGERDASGGGWVGEFGGGLEYGYGWSGWGGWGEADVEPGGPGEDPALLMELEQGRSAGGTGNGQEGAGQGGDRMR